MNKAPRAILRSGSFARAKSYTNELPGLFRSPGLNGKTVGDDSHVHGLNYLGVADGVGVWNTQEHGHAGLWSRLMVHEWSLRANKLKSSGLTNPKLQICHELDQASLAVSQKTRQTDTAEWLGTTTVLVGLFDPYSSVLHVCSLGDSSLLIFDDQRLKFATEDLREYFDVPRQIGTNAAFTFEQHSLFYSIPLTTEDVVVTCTDGLVDNLFQADIFDVLRETANMKLEQTAEELVTRAMTVGDDSWAASPYMERAVAEGIPFSGGKRDDCTVIVSRMLNL